MVDIWVGTSGWNYPHWRGVLYPRGLPRRRWLSFYAERFRTTEINYTHYREPSEESWDAWREAVPRGFRFAVKAHRFLTHRLRLHDPQDSLGRILKGAQRLGDRLGPVLYQLPPFFKRTDENAARLQRFLEILPRGHMHAFEFRHVSWFGAETQDALRARGAAFCSYDMPGIDCPLVDTAPFAYVRFHGTGPHYSGRYSDEMLESWAARLRALARGLDDVFVYFNNDAGGHAVDNAKTLARLLEAPVPESANPLPIR